MNLTCLHKQQSCWFHDWLLQGVLAIISCTSEALSLSSTHFTQQQCEELLLPSDWWSISGLSSDCSKASALFQTTNACLLARRKRVGSCVEFMYRFNRVDCAHIKHTHCTYVWLNYWWYSSHKLPWLCNMHKESKQKSCGLAVEKAELRWAGRNKKERGLRHSQTDGDTL